MPEVFASLVVPDPVQAGTVYAVNGEENLYRSTDRGGSWSFLSPQLGIRVLAAFPGSPAGCGRGGGTASSAATTAA